MNFKRTTNEFQKNDIWISKEQLMNFKTTHAFQKIVDEFQKNVIRKNDLPSYKFQVCRLFVVTMLFSLLLQKCRISCHLLFAEQKKCFLGFCFSACLFDAHFCCAYLQWPVVKKKMHWSFSENIKIKNKLVYLSFCIKDLT